MQALGSGFYTADEIESFIAEIGTMDDAVVIEGNYFVAEDIRGSIVASGGWSQLVPAYARALDGGTCPDLATLRSVFVDPTAARRGLGTALTRHAERDAAQRDIEVMRLTATLSGAPLYVALGYSSRRRRDLVLSGGIRFAVVEMEKSLVPVRAAC